MLKKLFLLITLVFVAILLKACCKDEPRYFRYTGMKIAHSDESRNTASGNLIVDTGKIYLLSIQFDVEYLASNQLNFNTCFLFNTAYATKACPGPGYEGSKEEITKISITSNTRFDSTHAAGENLNYFFSFFSGYSSQQRVLSVENIRFSPVSNPAILLILAQKPILDSVHTFTVQVELSNGKNFTAQTPPVTFRR